MSLQLSNLLGLLTERHTVYAFYPFGPDIVVSKLPDMQKYIISADSGCSCKGFVGRKVCKHVNMLRGVWTPSDGTPTWYESEFDGILPAIELPEVFNTAVVKTDLPHEYQMLCLTVEYQKFRMGIQVVDVSKYQQEIFAGVINGLCALTTD